MEKKINFMEKKRLRSMFQNAVNCVPTQIYKMGFKSVFYMCLGTDITWFEGFVIILEDHLTL